MASHFGGGSIAHNPTDYRAPTLPYLWESYRTLHGLVEHRTLVDRSRCVALREQFKSAINDAEACYRQGVRDQEIGHLAELLQRTIRYFHDSRDQQWTTVLYQNSGFEGFIFDTANELDTILLRLQRYLGNGFTPTNTLINQAHEEDRRHTDQFVTEMDRALPNPGGLATAYRNRDGNRLDTFVGQLFKTQTEILSGSPELQDNASQNAQRLAALIMNATNKKPDPSIMLGRGFVGQWKLLRSTAHYDLFTSKYVTEETVVIKALRDKIDGRDRNSQLPRFQKTAELWASLRSDYTLPFHGIGMSEQNGQIQIYSVSPFLPNGDAAKYHQNRFVPPAQSLQIVLDAAQGLNYLHNKRPAIVHFGVRTDDILITDDGRGVLAGFGLMKEADDISIATQTGMASDSYRFLPPEHLAGTSFPHKTSADVWAWAMIALHLVGGNKPYYDSTDLQAAMLISNGQRPMREKYPRLRDITDPDAFWELLNDCWAVDEARRPDMDNIVDRMKQLVGKPSEVLRPIAIRPGDGATMDEEPVDGRSQPPTAQGRDPRRGQH